MTVLEIYWRATLLGLRLEPRSEGRLAVIPGSRLPNDLAQELSRHKAELLALIEAKALNLPPDCVPWVYIGKQVLQHEFDGADDSTRESVRIGLRGVDHPRCREALEYLLKMQKTYRR